MRGNLEQHRWEATITDACRERKWRQVVTLQDGKWEQFHSSADVDIWADQWDMQSTNWRPILPETPISIRLMAKAVDDETA